MSLQYIFRPIERWPRAFTVERQNGRFTAKFNDTLDLLETELWHLEARNVVIQAAVSEGDLRNDGMLRSGARPSHPGIILSFDSKYGPLSLPCDEMHDWRHNLRAIAMHLHHLRKSTLYGVGRYGEQYKGWAQLPPATQVGQDAEGAARYIVNVSGHPTARWDQVLSSRVVFKEAYQGAVKRCHPDTGGNHDDFVKLQQAADRVKQHHTEREVVD